MRPRVPRIPYAIQPDPRSNVTQRFQSFYVSKFNIPRRRIVALRSSTDDACPSMPVLRHCYRLLGFVLRLHAVLRSEEPTPGRPNRVIVQVSLNHGSTTGSELTLLDSRPTTPRFLDAYRCPADDRETPRLSTARYH